MSNPNLSPRDFRQEVTDNIIRLLEEGTAPWQKPWEASAIVGMPINPTTGKAYRGGNAMHLIIVGMNRGYNDSRWLTYKQASENEWQVRKGEKGTNIEYWEVRKPKMESTKTDDEVEKPRFVHRVFTVFNATQIEGVPPIEAIRRTEFDTIEAGERIMSASGARILHDQADRAFYRRATDAIHLPPRSAFKGAREYYGTSLHELAHWTGHPTRLDRQTMGESYRFGDPEYAREELRAELASVFLAAEHGIPHDPNRHAAYVASWIKALQEDKNEIFKAAHDAATVADYINALSLEKGVGDQKENAGEVQRSHVQRLRSEAHARALDYSRG